MGLLQLLGQSLILAPKSRGLGVSGCLILSSLLILSAPLVAQFRLTPIFLGSRFGLALILYCAQSQEFRPFGFELLLPLLMLNGGGMQLMQSGDRRNLGVLGLLLEFLERLIYDGPGYVIDMPRNRVSR